MVHVWVCTPTTGFPEVTIDGRRSTNLESFCMLMVRSSGFSIQEIITRKKLYRSAIRPQGSGQLLCLLTGKYVNLVSNAFLIEKCN